MTRLFMLAFALCLLAAPALADRLAPSETPPAAAAAPATNAPTNVDAAGAAAGPSPAPADNIDLTSAEDIADAKTVSADLTTITDKVMACVKEGAMAAECQCKFMSDLGTLKDATAAALKKHPDWTDKVVNYRVNGAYMIVDRLFAAAELRLGADPQQIVRIVRTDGKKPS